MAHHPEPRRFSQYFKDGFPLEIMPIRHHGATELHLHDFSELVIVLSGTGIHRSPAGDYRIDAGDVFVLHGNQAHGYRKPEDLNLVNILFRMDELAIPLHDVASLPGYHALFTLEPLYRERDRFESRLRLAPDELRHISGTIERLIHEGRTHPPGWRFALMAGFMLLVTDLSRYYAGREERAAQPLLSLGRVIGHLEQHYNQPLTLDELAALGRMSRRTLCREFRRAMGCSPVEYLIRIRITHAARLLQESAESITEVAFRVGFNDSNYFARQFRALQGATPRDFRRATARA